MSSSDQDPSAGTVADTNAGGAGELRSETCTTLTEEEKRLREDYEWCLHAPEVHRLHGGQVVAVSGRRIWGTGPDHGTALQAALREPGCPPRRQLALVVVPEGPPARPG